MRTCMPKCKQRLLTALGQKYEKDIQTSPAQRAYATSEYNSDTSRVTLQFVMVLCRSCHSQGHSLCVLCIVCCTCVYQRSISLSEKGNLIDHVYSSVFVSLIAVYPSF